VFMAPINSPWEVLKSEIENIKEKVDYIIVDFHAEATAEKMALGRYLSELGVTFFTGTHTHVQTADERVFTNGLGYITDVGMTGPVNSVLGIKPDQSLKMFRGDVPVRFETASGPCKICGAVFYLDDDTFRCTRVERVAVDC